MNVSLSTNVANRNLALISYITNVGLRMAQKARYSLHDSEDADEKILGEEKTDYYRVMRIIYNKPTRRNSGSIVFINNYKYALHVSDVLCVHHQEHYKL